jgi:hypothetical protein
VDAVGDLRSILVQTLQGTGDHALQVDARLGERLLNLDHRCRVDRPLPVLGVDQPSLLLQQEEALLPRLRQRPPMRHNQPNHMLREAGILKRLTLERKTTAF